MFLLFILDFRSDRSDRLLSSFCCLFGEGEENYLLATDGGLVIFLC